MHLPVAPDIRFDGFLISFLLQKDIWTSVCQNIVKPATETSMPFAFMAVFWPNELEISRHRVAEIG
jgi:hypothetical protein